MLSPRLVQLALLASLALACSHTAVPPAAPRAAPPRLEDDAYVTIHADVSVSASAREAELKSASLDPGADVMAEILAIPPGR
jgi:hypothetical protein